MVLLSIERAETLGIRRRWLYEESLFQEKIWRRLSTHKLKEFLVKEELEEEIAWLASARSGAVEEVLIRGEAVSIFVADSNRRNQYQWAQARISWHGLVVLGAPQTRLFFASRDFVNCHVSLEEQRENSLLWRRVCDREEDDA